MIIRPVDIADAAAILSIYAPYIESTAYTFETVVPSVEEYEQRIRTNTSNYPWLVAVEDNKVIGYAYASRHRERAAYQWTVESSVYVAEDYHQAGVAKKLYETLFELLKSAGFVNIFAVITLPNPKSYAFHLKMGFEPVCVYKNIGFKLGRWHDVAWLQKTINPHSPEPESPRSGIAMGNFPKQVL